MEFHFIEQLFFMSELHTLNMMKVIAKMIYLNKASCLDSIGLISIKFKHNPTIHCLAWNIVISSSMKSIEFLEADH